MTHQTARRPDPRVIELDRQLEEADLIRREAIVTAARDGVPPEVIARLASSISEAQVLLILKEAEEG